MYAQFACKHFFMHMSHTGCFFTRPIYANVDSPRFYILSLFRGGPVKIKHPIYARVWKQILSKEKGGPGGGALTPLPLLDLNLPTMNFCHAKIILRCKGFPKNYDDMICNEICVLPAPAQFGSSAGARSCSSSWSSAGATCHTVTSYTATCHTATCYTVYINMNLQLYVIQHVDMTWC